MTVEFAGGGNDRCELSPSLTTEPVAGVTR
jgi:hypothetical protein